MEVSIRDAKMDNNPNGDIFFVKYFVKSTIITEPDLLESNAISNSVNMAIKEEPITYKIEGDTIKAVFPRLDVIYSIEDDGSLKITCLLKQMRGSRIVFRYIPLVSFFKTISKVFETLTEIFLPFWITFRKKFDENVLKFNSKCIFITGL